MTNSKGQTTSFIRDAQGKVLVKILPNQDQIKFEYTDGNDYKKITTPSNQVHYFQKDIGDYISAYLTPDNKSTSFEYDADKHVSKVTLPSGQTIKSNYDPGTKNLASVETSNGNYNFSYDLLARPTQMTSPDNIKTNLIWISDQLQQQKWFDTDGSELATISYIFQPDNLRKPKQILLNNKVIANIKYSPSTGDISKINNNSYTISNNLLNTGLKDQKITVTGLVNITYQNFDSFDVNNLVKPTKLITLNAIDKTTNYNLFITLLRSFDSFGEANEYSTTAIVTPSNVLNSYYQLVPSYDENNRLIEIQKNRQNFVNGQVTSTTDFYNHYLYPVNSNNNMKEFTQVAADSSAAQKRTVASHGPDDRLLSLRGSINRDYTYTDDGQIKTMSNCNGVISYEHDVFGNLKKVTKPDGTIIEYKLDGQNRRVKKLVNGQTKEYYLWYDQIHIAAILDENKVPKLTYLYGPGSNSPSYVIKNGIEYRIVQDPGLGSIRFIVHPVTGMIVQDIEYDEYGNMMKNSDPTFQPLTYAGGLFDSDTKFIIFGARSYDPTIGRWTTKDPIGFAGGDTNWYAYVGGNPMSYNDPSGKGPLGTVATVLCETFTVYGYNQLKNTVAEITETVKNQQDYIARLRKKSNSPNCSSDQQMGNEAKILAAEKELSGYLAAQARANIELGSTYAIGIACLGLSKF